jgi:hypothetical protein
LRNAATIGLQAGIVGAFVSAVQNALGSHSRGAAGFLTRSGGTIGTFGKRNKYACNTRVSGLSFIFTAAMGAAFAFTESAVANQRATNDALNGIAGGCAAGFLAGLRSVLSSWIYYSLILYVNPSTFNTGCTWIVRCNWRGYGHLRLRRGNYWQVKRGEGGEEKEVLQISTSTCPSRFRVEAASPHFVLELNAGTELAHLENFKYIQQIFEDTT